MLIIEDPTVTMKCWTTIKVLLHCFNLCLSAKLNRLWYLFTDIEAENCDLTELPQETLNIIEADSYWCMSKLLDGIQDNYTFAQPGIQMKVNALNGLIKRING